MTSLTRRWTATECGIREGSVGMVLQGCQGFKDSRESSTAGGSLVMVHVVYYPTTPPTTILFQLCLFTRLQSADTHHDANQG
ncbi:hypothetical protein E2C01_056629 [Portunus trituberculatus]|uniref:Uncharacterized protein n=1 Tax=Portunus trituberculatus TaxID=210409 RepID=A0A5B7GXX8_PORTR|nr:hypothetical protein [Portunus trituberculatus]